jgi:surface protein
MKTIKRVLSIIISLFMLLPLFPMNIVAYTNGHTSQDAVNWAISLVNSNWGTSENTPNYDGSSWTPGDYGEPQCVDLIAAYWDYLADYHLGINAKDYADINLPSGWYYTTSPSAGDIAVWTGGTWGHVGIVTSVADTYICFVDCNGEGHWTDGNGYRHNDGATLRDTIGHPLGYPTIFIHPDFATTKPKANVDRGADGVYFIGEDCKISLSGDTSNLYNLKIYRTPTGGETYLYWEGDIYSTNYTLHLYEPGYYACSFVLDPYGSQIWSEMVGWIVRPVAPSAPTVSVSGTDVTVSWKDVYGESSYNVYLVQSPWAWEDIKYKATVDADVTTYTFKNIAPGNYRAFIISMPNGTEVQSGWTSFDVVSFGPWDGNNTITPYVGETNAIIGQTINVSDGDPSDSGMYLYDENGNQLASASNGQLSKWWGYVYFDINNELGYVLSELTTYKYKFYVTLNGKTYWSDMGSFTTGGTKITLNKSSLSLQKGETASLTATVLPSGTSVTWSTSNKNVATVSNGTVTAVGTGTATITATANGKTASCAVSVTRPAWEYSNGVLHLYFGEYTGDFFQNFENRSDTVQIIADAGVKFTGSFYNAFGDKYPSCESIDFSKVDTSGVINMGYMFYKCSSLTSLDVSGFDTSNVSDMGYMFFGCSSLTSLDVSGFDTSKVTYMQSMFYNCRNLTSLDVSGFETSNVTNMSFMFDECQNLTSLDVSGFDTSKVTYMKSMFYNCRNLTSLDVSGFETSNVTDMSFMFAGCQNLTSLDVSGFDTSNVTNMSKMFSGCSSLTSLDLSGFDTSNVTNMGSMFSGCSSFTSLDVSGFDTSNVTSMDWMFSGCSKLTSLDVSGFDTPKVTDMGGMFWDCESLTSLDLSGFDTSNVTSINLMFYNCSSLTSLDLSGFDTSNVTSMESMFSGCSSLTSLDLSGFDTSNVTSMNLMFRDCSSLTSLDVSGFDTSNVTDMYDMFGDCSSLTSLDVSSFDTSNVTSMYWMFGGCSKLTSLDVSGFDTSNVTDISGMFSWCGSLTSLDVSGFDTSNVTSMNWMFSGCSKLTSLDVSSFDTSNVTSMGRMFSDCSSLTSLDVSGFDTSNVTYMYMDWMFSGCENLTSLDLSGFDTSNVTDMGYMFFDCPSLSSLVLPVGFNVISDVCLNNGMDNLGWTKTGSDENISGTGQYAEFVSDGGTYVWLTDTKPEEAKGTLTVKNVEVMKNSDTVSVEFVLENTEKIKSISLSSFTFDSSVFEIVDGQWKIADAVIANYNTANKTGVAAFADDTDVNGIIFELTLKIKDDAPAGDYDISCAVAAKKKSPAGGEENVKISVEKGTITIVDILPGDVDGDGFVTSDDAIHLLYYTFLPDMFPVNQNCDFDGNGAVDSDDAIYLLYYTFLPDMFPLN